MVLSFRRPVNHYTGTKGINREKGVKAGGEDKMGE